MMWNTKRSLLNYLQMCKFPKHTSIHSVFFFPLFCAKFTEEQKNYRTDIFNNVSWNKDRRSTCCVCWVVFKTKRLKRCCSKKVELDNTHVKLPLGIQYDVTNREMSLKICYFYFI